MTENHFQCIRVSDSKTFTVKTADLQFFPTSEGFYDYKKDQYIYQYKDHLGNVRVSFARNSAGALEITDNNDYYPFGMNHLKSGNAFFGQNSYKSYKYNGKELQETGMYDYGARMYMADIGRWGVVDPLTETTRRFSTYNYALNNPISFIDPDGRKAITPTEGLQINSSSDSAWWGSFKKHSGSSNWSPDTEVWTGGGDNNGGYATFGQTQMYKDIMAYLADDGSSLSPWMQNYIENFNFVALNDSANSNQEQTEQNCCPNYLNPSGEVIFTGLSEEKLNSIKLIPENVTQHAELYSPKNGVLYKIDGFYIKDFSDSQYWFKIGDGRSVTITDYYKGYVSYTNEIKGLAGVISKLGYQPKTKPDDHWYRPNPKSPYGNPFDKNNLKK